MPQRLRTSPRDRRCRPERSPLAAGAAEGCFDSPCYQYRLQPSSSPPKAVPSARTSSARTAATAMSRGFHCNIVDLPERRNTTPSILYALQNRHITRKGELCGGRSAAGEEAGLGERTARPRELLSVPPGQRRNRD